MKNASNEYDVKLDLKNRLTIRNPKSNHYIVIEKDDGQIILIPKELTLSKKTYDELKIDVENLKNGIVSDPVKF